MNIIPPQQHKPQLRWADEGSKVEASFDDGETWKVIGEFVIQGETIGFATLSKPWPVTNGNTSTSIGAEG